MKKVDFEMVLKIDAKIDSEALDSKTEEELSELESVAKQYYLKLLTEETGIERDDIKIDLNLKFLEGDEQN